jgi:hypothetical protein
MKTSLYAMFVCKSDFDLHLLANKIKIKAKAKSTGTLV